MAAAGFDDLARERADVPRQESRDWTCNGHVEPATDLIGDERGDNPQNALLVRLRNVKNFQSSSSGGAVRRSSSGVALTECREEHHIPNCVFFGEDHRKSIDP